MPDLNSVPVSPRNHTTTTPQLTGAQAQAGSSNTAEAQASRQSSTTVSRRTSQIYPMSPPPPPLSLHSPTQQTPYPTIAPQSPSLVGSVPSFDAAGVPMRHPRPLTAAELHLELEKEQEAVVNRLTRELSALRAHSASVASTASSVTSGMHEVDAGVAARRQRSDSSVSRTSVGGHAIQMPDLMLTLTGHPLNPPTTLPHHRYSISSQPATDAFPAQQARSASVVSTPRYEEVAHYRQELEEAKRENEGLKRRIRELERALRGDGGDAGSQGQGQGQRGRTGAPGGE